MFVHGFYAEEDVDLFYDLDENGVPVRSVTVSRSSAEVESAVDSREWMAALREGTLDAYMVRYGPPADVQLDESDLSFYEELSQARFDFVWREARDAMDLRWVEGGRSEYDSRDESVPPWTPLSRKAYWNRASE